MVPAGSRLHLAIQICPDYQKSDITIDIYIVIIVGPTTQEGSRLSQTEVSLARVFPLELTKEYQMPRSHLKSQFVYQLVCCCGPQDKTQTCLLDHSNPPIGKHM